ncbi:hypothetical protein BV20DRAFT_960794 [Pilatotrama ljubarskyi]|nr:hypothetical protein BV20DRAFT_960794 [Pilatotrama ljubarskyi]
MSDSSDDDLAGNYGPTTPAPPKKGRPRAGGSKPVAGPSTKPVSRVTVVKQTANRAGSTIELDDDEDQDVVMVDEQPAKKRRKATEDSDEVVAIPGPSKGVAKKSAARSEPAPNGTSKSAAAKGKARADAFAKSTHTNGTSAEAVEREDVVELDDDDEPPDPPAQRGVRGSSKQPKNKTAPHTSAPARSKKADEKLAREVESLRAQLEQSREVAKEVAVQRDKLAKQLEEVFRVRETAAEQLLHEYKAQVEESLERKEALIEELTAQLSKLQSSSKSDKSYTLHFLTREAAEEEKQALREENNLLRETIKQRDATIASKEKQIHSLQDEAKIMKRELDAEIERSKTLAARAPPPMAARQQKPAPSEFRNTPVIRLYEDMTNILVTSVKIEKSSEFPDLEEEIAACVYSYENEEDKKRFSLNFTLRSTYDRPEGVAPSVHLTKEQLEKKMKYEPKDLDKESPELVERLGFFKDPFMFKREQMTVFLKTLTDAVINIFEPEGEGDGADGDESPEVIIVDG